jgi:predicted hydrocarbon binding protein
MDLKKELIALRIFLANYHNEVEKTFGTNTVKAILFRMGQKPGDIIADEILSKYDKSPENPFDLPSAAFSLFQNTITKLYNTEIIEQTDKKDRVIIKIKNVCVFRNVIKSREELEYGGTLCEFTAGYFENALKTLLGMDVEYQIDKKETTEEYCVIKIIFFKNLEQIDEEHSSTNTKTAEIRAEGEIL